MNDALTPVVDVYDGSKQVAEKIIDWYYTFLNTIFPDKSGNDYVTMPQIVTGTGAIYWTDENGVKRLETGEFIFSSELTSGATIFSAGGVNFDLVDNPDYSGGSVASTYISANVTSGNYGLYVSNVFRVCCTVAPGTQDGAVKLSSSVRAISSDSSSYSYNGSAGTRFGVVNANFSTLKNDKNTSFNTNNAGDNVKLNDLRQNIINEINEQYPESTQNVDDFLIYDDWLNYENTDPTEPSGGGESDAGNVIINNYDTLNFENNVSGDADIDFNGSVEINADAGAFGAGAFGAGAFNDVDINVNAGAFGAGAFGAGAIGDVTVSGNVYNIESGAVLELPTLDYDEILSEKELELILTSETYEIAELETETLLTLEEGYTLPPPAPLPEGLVTMSAGLVSDTWSAFDSWGLTSVYLPLAIVTIVVFVLRGAK